MAFKITVEVPILLSFFSFMLTGSIYTNLIIFRTCYITLGYNKSDCALLGNVNNNETRELETLVEPEAAIINMVRSTTDSVFTVVLCLFIGPWSDRFGRKPILVANLIGSTISHLAVAVFSYFQNLSPWYSVICIIPSIITGGGASYITVILAYITDISNEETTSIRMTVFEVVKTVASLLGHVSSSYVFYATNYVTVFGISTLFGALSALYVIFFVSESLPNQETQGKFKGFFQISNLGDMVKSALKPRENFNRSVILIIMAILTIYMFVIFGDGGLLFLYLRDKLNWTLTKYTLFSSATSVIWIIGTVGGTFIFHKLLHLNEAVLLLFGCISMTISALFQGLGNKDLYIYAAGCIRCLGGVISPMARSLVAKLVPDEETGKVFALIMASENIFGIGSSPLYTAVYKATINTDPGFFNYITACAYTFNIILTIIVIVVQNIRSSPPTYDTLNNEEQQENTNGPTYVIN